MGIFGTALLAREIYHCEIETAAIRSGFGSSFMILAI